MCCPPPLEQTVAKRLRAGADGSGSNPRASKRGRDSSGNSSGGSRDADTELEAPPSSSGGARDGGAGGCSDRPKPAAIYGVFHPDRYLSGEDCIDYQVGIVMRGTRG